MRPKANLRGRFSPSTTALRSGHRPEDPKQRYDPSARGERPLSNTALDRITRLIDASNCPASLTSISRPELHEVSVSLTEQRSECRLTAAINAVDQVEAACSTVSTLKESQARRTLA